MSFSRRKFLQQGTLAALVCAGPLRVLGASGNGPGNNLPHGHITGKVSNLNRKVFESAVGSSFKVSGGAEAAWLQLAAVEDLPALAPQNTGAMAVLPPQSSSVVTTEGFMLSFTGGPSTGLAQGTYLFENGALGQFRLFIVPDGRTPQAYAAVFNQLASTAAIVAPTPSPSKQPGRSRPGSAPGKGTAGTGNASGVGNASESGTGQPAQEPLEPVFGHSLKSKLPE